MIDQLVVLLTDRYGIAVKWITLSAWPWGWQTIQGRRSIRRYIFLMTAAAATRHCVVASSCVWSISASASLLVDSLFFVPIICLFGFDFESWRIQRSINRLPRGPSSDSHAGRT